MRKSTLLLVVLIFFLLLSSIVSAQFKFVPLDIISNFFNTILKSLGITTTSTTQKTIPSSGSIAYGCSGKVSLTLSPNPVNAINLVTATASGLSNCDGKTFYFKKDSCSGTQVASCTVSGTGCSFQFNSPQITSWSYYASESYTNSTCIDKNGDNDFNDDGESDSKTLIVALLAPDFTLTDLNGHSFSLKGNRGKVVLVDFWSISCPHCINEEMPHLRDVNDTFNSKPFVIISIGSWDVDSPDADRQWLSTHKDQYGNYYINDWTFVTDSGTTFSKYTYYISGDAPTKWGIPALYVIDKNGFIRYFDYPDSRGYVPADIPIGQINDLFCESRCKGRPEVFTSGACRGICQTGETSIGQADCSSGKNCCCYK